MMNQQIKSACFVVAAAVSVPMMAGSAQAELISSPGSLFVNFFVGDEKVLSTDGTSLVFATDAPNLFTSTGASSGSGWSMKWSSVFDPDPFINANVEVKNESALTQTFTVEFFMPVGIDLSNAVYSGSVAGKLEDDNGDGASASAPDGGAIYAALIDGSVFHTLLDNPLIFLAGPNQEVDFNPEKFGNSSEGGVAGPALLGDEVLGLRYTFVLTPGDTLFLDGNFTVSGAPVPAPAALPLLALGSVCFRGRRRR